MTDKLSAKCVPVFTQLPCKWTAYGPLNARYPPGLKMAEREAAFDLLWRLSLPEAEAALVREIGTQARPAGGHHAICDVCIGSHNGFGKPRTSLVTRHR